MERDERLDDIAESLRRVAEQQATERKERIERDERIDGRLSQIEHRQSEAERREKNRASEWLQVIARVEKAERAAHAAQQTASDAVQRSAEHMGAVITHIGKMDARLGRQDVVLERLVDVGARQDAELADQTKKLDHLVAADTERASFEKWTKDRAAADDARGKKRREIIAWGLGCLVAIATLIGAAYGAIRIVMHLLVK